MYPFYKDKLPRTSKFTPLGEAIKQFLAHYHLEDKVVEAQVLDIWNLQMGHVIQSRTLRLYIKNKVLYIKVNSSSLKEQLLYSKSQVIDIIHEKLGFVYLKDVVIQ